MYSQAFRVGHLNLGFKDLARKGSSDEPVRLPIFFYRNSPMNTTDTLLPGSAWHMDVDSDALEQHCFGEAQSSPSPVLL